MNPDIIRKRRTKELETRQAIPVNGPVTIGPRDSTGRYDVIYADSGVGSGRGVKCFNAAHEEGDIVIAIPKQDGTIALEGPTWDYANTLG